jgi:hypothetical protein
MASTEEARKGRRLSATSAASSPNPSRSPSPVLHPVQSPPATARHMAHACLLQFLLVAFAALGPKPAAAFSVGAGVSVELLKVPGTCAALGDLATSNVMLPPRNATLRDLNLAVDGGKRPLPNSSPNRGPCFFGLRDSLFFLGFVFLAFSSLEGVLCGVRSAR